MTEYRDGLLYKTSTNAYLEISKGNVPGESLVSPTGKNTVNTTESVIMDGLTGRYPFPSTANIWTIESSDTNDNIVGTGAQIVILTGLTTTDRTATVEAVLLNGTTPVNTTNNWFRINNLVVVAAGSIGHNIGLISLKDNSSVMATVIATDNVSLISILSTTTNVEMIITHIQWNVSYNDQARIRTYVKSGETPTIDSFAPFERDLYQTSMNLPVEPPFSIPAASDIEFTAEALSVSATVGISFLAILRELP